jgi:tripartite-type tricarboxylate transporter receptor subunit TctC
MSGFPDVPTLKELGYSDFVEVTWFGIAAPANTPREIVAKMNGAINEVFARADVKERNDSDGNEVKPMTPEAFTEFMGNEMNKWRPLAGMLKTQ